MQILEEAGVVSSKPLKKDKRVLSGAQKDSYVIQLLKCIRILAAWKAI